ncbi:CocE/NonD family hydrolase [Synechococcus sp. A10-1-5-1]|uniref:CocE/NonD family hydrolase n=1 Tax=Synechococcus sp. A10-1-5-1 TaxID=2936507 RepID=UPI0020011385|nr:CocE/NonD family hydrolase [Synechococcus sp. A10-1-5-1]UPM50359.1 CocE/NonD family hydrolase [Synechococcus sp. A10-1-5-1]
MTQEQLRCADGTVLESTLWTPGGEGPWPCLLMRQPYGRAIASTVTYAHPSWYAQGGFAVLVQDVRGRGDSEGAFLGFQQEASDTSETLRWMRQQPWCNGKVGTYGFSYQGLSQLLYSSTEHLPDALAPAMCGLDERLHWASEGGCHWWALGLGWALQLAAQHCQREGDHQGWEEIRRSLEDGAFVRDGMALLERFDPTGMGLRWLKSDPRQPDHWVQHHTPQELWQRPMLLIGGWHDPHLMGVLDLWNRSSSAGGATLLRIGAWSHLNWKGGVDQLQLDFFHHHLCGHEPATPLAGTQLMESGSGQWQVRSPRECSGQRWRLASGGRAALCLSDGQLLERATSSSDVVIVHDPWRAMGGRGGHLGLDAGPVDRSDLDARTDVACFTTARFDQATEVFGQPQLEIEAEADQPGFDLCLALSLCHMDGRVEQLSTGVARFLGPSAQRCQRRSVALQPLLINVEAGCALRLSIALAAWPQIAVNPGDGSQPRSGVSPSHRVITVSLKLPNAALSILPMVGAN